MFFLLFFLNHSCKFNNYVGSKEMSVKILIIL